MKRILRHFSSWLLMLGMAVSFFSFLNGDTIYQRIKYAALELNEYRYKNTYHIQISNIKDRQALYAALEELDGNVCLTNLHLYLNDEKFYHLTEYMVKQEEELPYPVEWIAGDGDVIISELLLPCCKREENGSLYLEIEGERYVVYGIVHPVNSDLLSGKLVISPLGSRIRECLERDAYFDVEYGSSRQDIDEAVRDFYKAMSGNCEIYYEKDTEEYFEVGSYHAKERYHMLIAVFAMLNCIVISEFWIIRRREEVIIRKLWGFSDLKLYCRFYGELMMLSGISVLVVLAAQALFYLGSGHVYGAVSVRQLLLGCGFAVVAAALVVIKPIYQAAHYRASDGLEG